MIAELYAKRIIEGKKTFDDVPRLLKDKVREILVESGYEKLVTEGNSENSSCKVGG